jgi:hypothetical protein
MTMSKKVYTKPTIEKVELKPEEAALTACKVEHSIGFGGVTHCRTGHSPCIERTS